MPQKPRLPGSGRISVTPSAPGPKPILMDAAAGRFRLRSLRPQDVRPDWLDWLSDPGVMEGLNAPARAMSLDDLRAYVGRFDHFLRSLIGIFDPRRNLLVGLVMIETDPRHKLASVHMLVGNKQYWGRGAAIAAGEAAVRHCFDQRKVEKVMFCPLADNQPAIAVCLFHRLRLEGIFRSHRTSAKSGKRVDQLQFAITREEYEDRNRPAEKA